ncbi:MAG: tetratricopeptide repeat protein [candidate division WOR-3 bacterium]
MGKRRCPIRNEQPRRSGSGGARVLPLVLVFSLALVVRVIYLLVARKHDPLFFAPQMDGLYHHQWAVAIARGMEFINDAYFRAPLYPFFLGLIYRVFGPDLFTARLIQAVLGSASCVLLSLLGRQIFDRQTGFYAGLAMAVYPLFIYFDGELLIPVLLVFLLLCGLVLFYLRDKNRFLLPLAGLCFGLGAIARPNVILVVAALGVWLVVEYQKRWWRRALPFYLAVVLPIVPVTVRNYIKSRSLVLIAWQAGTNFFIGNNEFSDGTTAIVPGTRGSWWGGYNDVRRIAESESGQSLKGVEIDRFWLKKGLKFWRRHPAGAILLTLRKLYLWFAGYEVSNNRDLYFFKRYTFLNFLLFTTPVLKFPFGIVFPLAVIGIYLSRQRWRTLMPIYLFLGAYTLSFIPFFVTARYRLPLVPLYLLFAIAGAGAVFRVEARARRRALIVGAAVFFVVNLNLAGAGRRADPAQNHFLAANGYYQQGRTEPARRELDQALALDSAANILSLEATMLLAQNRIPAAAAVAQAAVRLHPDEADSYGIAGNVYAAAGKLDSAEMMFYRVVELDPFGPEGWNNLGNLALARGELAQARRYYEQALKNSPNFVLALFHLGLVDYYQGRVGSAHARWQQVLKLDPGFHKAGQALEELR